MKVIEIIQNEISLAYPEIHKTRLNTLFTFVQSGLMDQRLTVTYLGRGLKGLSKTEQKHDIKRADRLCGNTFLQYERIDFYKYMTESLISNERHPLLIVDWSPINGNEIFQLLRVSIPMGGRALTIYEKVYKESELNTRAAHQELLNAIEYCLPEGCRPIILADAIFKTPWFKAIENMGWYWVCRVRGNVQLSIDGENWQRSSEWFASANSKATTLGDMYFSKTTKHPCVATLYKGRKKGRIKKKLRGGKSQCSTDKYQEKKAKEPWLLISCLPQKWDKNPKKVMKLYAIRMQIEEAFRDTKNGKLGVSLEFANSRTPERFDILLLIGALILYILWCIGFAAEQLNLHHYLQANTVKNKRVLSHIYLGREVIDDERYTVDDEFIIWVLHELPNLIIRLGNL
jgi:hypothetical protein